jgi:hypothetical protein
MPRWRVMKEVLLTPAALSLSPAAVRMLLDAHAHAGQFVFPLLAQRRGVSTVATTWAPKGGRVAVVGADGDLQLRQHARRFVLAGAHHAERADPLAVQREALGERGRDEEALQAGGQELAAPPRRPRRCRRRSPGRPCPGTGPGRAPLSTATTSSHCAGVMSQPVGLWQQACSTTMVPAGGLQRGQHGVEAHAAVGGVVVGIGATLKPALVNSARWFSQLGSLISTWARGSGA